MHIYEKAKYADTIGRNLVKLRPLNRLRQLTGHAPPTHVTLQVNVTRS